MGISLNEELEQKLKELGAIRVGFVTLETLAGGPEGANLKYLLPSAGEIMKRITLK